MSEGKTESYPLQLLERAEGWFKVKHAETGNTCTIIDTFGEMFPMWAGRALITAENEKWALIAARTATGFASSIIMSPAEAGIEGSVPSSETPDGRPGILIQMYQRDRGSLRMQMIYRIGQCVMTCPTAYAFDGLPKAKRRMKIGTSLSLFGDGFQEKGVLADRKVWRIPVMEGEFIIEDKFGAMRAIAGGIFLILAKDMKTGLHAAELATEAISRVKYVILPFPGGICRSGSKTGSMKYKLGASTNQLFCPGLKGLVTGSQVSEGVNSVYEIVINGLDTEAVTRAISEGVKSAAGVPGVLSISAVNFGGKLGPYKAYLREVLHL